MSSMLYLDHIIIYPIVDNNSTEEFNISIQIIISKTKVETFWSGSVIFFIQL